MENTKQVLIWNNSLKVRKGKIASQISHASMAFLTKNASISSKWEGEDRDWLRTGFHNYCNEIETHQDEINHWLSNSFRKIVCYVNSEEELLAIHQKALDSGLISHIITDNGATEFHGVPTITALAVGPHIDSRFIGITDHLPLL